MRFSLRLNNDLAPQIYRRIADTVDRSGIDQLWISHDLRFHAAPALVADLAARTEQLRLGIGLHNPYTVHPVELAMLASTLDELSDGRFDLGLGAGASGFLKLIGIDRDRPLAVMRSTLIGVRQLLRGEAITVEGWDPDLRLARAAPEVELWLGATGPLMRALGGELADGVLALAMPPSVHTRVVEEIKAGQASRRFQDPPDVPCCVWLSLDKDPGRADRALADKLELYGPELGSDLLAEVDLVADDFRPMPWPMPQPMRRLAIVGDADAVIEQCRNLLDSGVDHLSFGPPLGPDPTAAVEVLVETILPHLAPR